MKGQGHFGKHVYRQRHRPAGFHRPFWKPKTISSQIGGFGFLIGSILLLIIALMIFRPY